MDAEIPRYVLDSYALLAHFQAEPGAAQVAKLLELGDSGRTTLFISVVNVAEVLYILERQRGLDQVKSAIAIVNVLPLELLEVNRALAFSAAHIKANHPLSLADAFAAALAKEKRARLVTGDPEFESLAKEIPIEWLPRKGSH